MIKHESGRMVPSKKSEFSPTEWRKRLDATKRWWAKNKEHLDTIEKLESAILYLRGNQICLWLKENQEKQYQKTSKQKWNMASRGNSPLPSH